MPVHTRYILPDKKTRPGFSFLVKTNTAKHSYYLFSSFERAMNQARVLSLTEFPLVIIYEPCQDKDGEWHLIKTFSYMSGKCYAEEDSRMELHAKFYTDAGYWLNSDEPLSPGEE